MLNIIWYLSIGFFCFSLSASDINARENQATRMIIPPGIFNFFIFTGLMKKSERFLVQAHSKKILQVFLDETKIKPISDLYAVSDAIDDEIAHRKSEHDLKNLLYIDKLYLKQCFVAVLLSIKDVAVLLSNDRAISNEDFIIQMDKIYPNYFLLHELSRQERHFLKKIQMLIPRGIFNFFIVTRIMEEDERAFVQAHSEKILQIFLNKTKIEPMSNSDLYAVSDAINDRIDNVQSRHNLIKLLKINKLYLKPCFIAVLLSIKYYCDLATWNEDFISAMNQIYPNYFSSEELCKKEFDFLEQINWKLHFYDLTIFVRSPAYLRRSTSLNLKSTAASHINDRAEPVRSLEDL